MTQGPPATAVKIEPSFLSPCLTPIYLASLPPHHQIQFTELPSSKSYIEVEGIDQLFECLLHLFELQVRMQHSEIVGLDKITYDYKDVLLFLENLKSICVLIFDQTLMAFVPKDLEWIKQQLLQHLQIQSY